MIGPLYEEPDMEGEGKWGEPVSDLPLLTSLDAPKGLRTQLHVICALYAHAPTLERKLALLDHLEELALQAIRLQAQLLLDAGWRPAFTPAADAA